MKRIAILGNSIVAAKIIEDLRATDRESEIVLWSVENRLPYYQSRLAEYMAKALPLSEVLCRAESFYKDSNVRLILGKQLTRVNFRKGQIADEEKETIDFDVLVLAGMADRKFPDIKGTNKIGVFDAGRLDDVDQVFKSLPFMDTLAIHVETMAGLKMAEAIQKSNKEVIVVVPGGAFILAEETQGLLKTLHDGGVRIFHENGIAEILGDADARAIRLKSGKVIACEAVIFERTALNLKLFQDTPLSINKRICVNTQLKTNFDNVFACAEMIEWLPGTGTDHAFSEEQLWEQGRVIAANIAGQGAEFALISPPPAILQGASSLNETVVSSDQVQQSQDVR